MSELITATYVVYSKTWGKYGKLHVTTNKATGKISYYLEVEEKGIEKLRDDIATKLLEE